MGHTHPVLSMWLADSPKLMLDYFNTVGAGSGETRERRGLSVMEPLGPEATWGGWPADQHCECKGREKASSGLALHLLYKQSQRGSSAGVFVYNLTSA